MGTSAAMKKAIMLLIDVRATLVPVLRRQSPVLSCTQIRNGTCLAQIGRVNPNVYWYLY